MIPFALLVGTIAGSSRPEEATQFFLKAVFLVYVSIAVSCGLLWCVHKAWPTALHPPAIAGTLSIGLFAVGLVIGKDRESGGSDFRLFVALFLAMLVIPAAIFDIVDNHSHSGDAGLAIVFLPVILAPYFGCSAVALFLGFFFGRKKSSTTIPPEPLVGSSWLYPWE